MNTIGETLKLEIEQYARSLLLANPLLVAAERGALTSKQITTYVSGILFQIRGSLGTLQRAGKLALAAGDQPLAEYYRHKFNEESGHDRWAERDLKGLNGSDNSYQTNGSMTALKKLMAYLGSVIDRDPCLFLPYLLLSEYLTVLVGPTWLQALEGKCGIPRDKLSVVANHVELDQGHVAEGVQTIDALVSASDKRETMLEVLRTSISYYDEFWEEILSAQLEAA